MDGEEASSSHTAITAPSTSSYQRAKVYRLNEDGEWDNEGTGHVTVEYLEEGLGLLVIGEEDSETLLLHHINPDDIYRKQEDTISWKDPELSIEVALSFQETTACSNIWNHICNVQRCMQFSSLNSETYHSTNNELMELPAVELSTLPLILKTVSEGSSVDQMKMSELLLNDQEFFPKLMDLFKICEELKNIDELHMIFKIVKGIILLNNPQIFDKIFADELMINIIGALEYDPEVSNVQHHREFLKDHVIFKEAIPIKDPLVLSKIHQTYRVGYLKDVVLAGALDDVTLASLNSVIHTNNATILQVISLLKDDKPFVQELFGRLKSPITSEESKKNLICFLHEFCTTSKSLEMDQQIDLFRDLITEGIFDIIADTFQSPDKKLVSTGTNILVVFLDQDSNLLQSYIVQQEGHVLLEKLVKGMLTDFGDYMHRQFLEILCTLLDSDRMTEAQRDNITEIFYEKHLDQLVDAIISSCPLDCNVQSTSKSSYSGGRDVKHTYVKPDVLYSICDLLLFCVLHHPCRIKCNFILNNTVDKVLLLTRRKEKCLVVAAVRFVRTILSHHDEHLISHFVKNNLLKPILDAFVCNGVRYNLLHSAVLELLEYICKENLKVLVKYIVDSFRNELVIFESLPPIQSLKVKYEECLDVGDSNMTARTSDSRKPSDASTSGSRERSDNSGKEKEEKDYLIQDSGEDDTADMPGDHEVQDHPVIFNVQAAGPSSSIRLVDYDDDDEDDEDYRPPPLEKEPEALDDQDEGVIQSQGVKRKLPSEEHDPTKKQQLSKNPISRASVFAALCSTLNQAVVPSKKSGSSTRAVLWSVDSGRESGEEIHEEKEAAVTRDPPDMRSNAGEENLREKESAASGECVQSASKIGQSGGEDDPLLASESSSTDMDNDY